MEQLPKISEVSQEHEVTSRVTEKAKRKVKVQKVEKVEMIEKEASFDEVAAIECYPEEEEKVQHERRLSFIYTDK